MLAGGPAAAEVTNCEIPDGIAYTRPSEKITEVRLRVILLDLHGISETAQAFSADFLAIGAWHDPRLGAEALGHSLEGCRLDASRIWSPRMQVLNLRNSEFPLSEIEVDRDGGVVRRTRMIGEFGNPMDLRDYPFDRQTLKISVVSRYGPDEIAIRIDDGDLMAFAEMRIPGWRTHLASAVVAVAPLQDVSRSGFDLDRRELAANASLTDDSRSAEPGAVAG